MWGQKSKFGLFRVQRAKGHKNVQLGFMHVHVLSDNVPNVADSDRGLEVIVGPSAPATGTRPDSGPGTPEKS